LRDDPETDVGDADQARDGAAAIGADDVAAADGVVRAVREVPHGRGDAVLVLRERDQLVAEAHPSRRERVGVILEDGLEPDLRQVQGATSTCRPPVLVVAAGAPRLELRDQPSVVVARSGEPCVERSRRHVLSGGAARSNVVGNTDVLEDFHRPLVEDVRLGEGGRGRQGADEQVVDIELRQQHRGGQAGSAAADDEDVDDLGRVVWAGHGVAPYCILNISSTMNLSSVSSGPCIMRS
jgi:hypothetical protein